MKREVYKSLDKSATVASLTGIFFLIFLVAAVLFVSLGIFIGVFIESTVGIVLGFGGIAASYLGASMLERKCNSEENVLHRWMSGNSVPLFISVRPGERRRTAEAVRNGTFVEHTQAEEDGC